MKKYEEFSSTVCDGVAIGGENVIEMISYFFFSNPTKSFTARLFHYVGWTETRVPNTYRPLISLLSQIERWQQQLPPAGRGPITIMCSDGIGRSGTLAAIIYVLERVKLNQVFDCFQAIKAMRIQRPHVVKYMVCLQ